MRRLLSTLLCFLLLAISSAVAREQSDAPEIEILGFSADGRYFAYEQYGYDLASDALDAAIFVIDRQTNQAAQGFPFGFISIEQDGDYPARVGGHDIDLETLRTEDGTPDLGQVRKLVRDKAAAKLAALAIGNQGRRLAGVPLTQRSPANDAQIHYLADHSKRHSGPAADLRHRCEADRRASGLRQCDAASARAAHHFRDRGATQLP
jgi:hypothetical protein